MIAVVAMTLLAFAAYLPNVATYFAPVVGDFCFSAGFGGQVTKADTACTRAGIAVGDRIEYAKMPVGERYVAGALAGTRAVFPVLHNGSEHRVALVATWKSPELRDKIFIVVRKLAWMFFVIVAAAILLSRPSRMTWGFYLYSLNHSFVALFFFMFLPEFAWWTLQYISNAVGYLGQVGFVVFALRFPQDLALGWRARAERLMGLIFAALCVFNAFLVFATLSGRIGGYSHDLLECVPLLLLYAVAWYALVMSYRRSQGIERIRLRWGIFGSITGTMLVAASTGLVYMPMLPDWLMNLFLAIGQLLVPTAIGYAIVRHRVIDVQFVVNRTIVFAAIGGAAAGVLIGIDWLSTAVLPLSRGHMSIALAFAFGFGLLVAKMYRRLVTAVDRALFPERRAAMECLNELRLAVERQNDAGALRSQLTSDVCTGIQLASAALFIPLDGGFVREAAFGWPSGTVWHLLGDDPIVRHVSRAPKKSLRVDDLEWESINVPAGAAHPLLVVPMTSRRRIVGLALYGAHTSGADLDPDEVRGLVDLCAAASPAFDQVEYNGAFFPGAVPAAVMRNAR
ncbi:MAG: hypothetical protein ACXVAC_17705 [Vulcanimicrobiaceae bacterium]